MSVNGRFSHAAFLVIVVAVSGGCGPQESQGPLGFDPSVCDPPCPDQEACVNGTCVPKDCDPPCDDGHHCDSGVCVADDCDPPCGSGLQCVAGACVAGGCDPPCAVGQHCEGTACLPNICDPPCETGETCMTHGSDVCECTSPPCGLTACTDGLDNDGDGWVDELDPDCWVSEDESGLGSTGCNDGIDNDGDGAVDGEDPECTSATGDEVLGDGVCADDCVVGTESQGRTCDLWDSGAMAWGGATLEDGEGHMHHRARNYLPWLRRRLMPVGGVMRGYFSDDTFAQIVAYGGTRDSPIWTGTYLGAESLRFMVTASPDAARQMDETIRALDRWWRISGDKGYLARFAAPANSPSPVGAIFDPADPENHRDVAFEGDTWHWKGRISRDQYQGTLLGYALAYDATGDSDLREIIRARVMDFVEVLATREKRQVNLVINGVATSMEMELGHAVYTDDETPNGVPRLTITTSPFDVVDEGMTIFWSNPSEYLRQIPLLSWLPDIYLRGQAIQIASAFQVALHVTDGVPSYAARRQAIAQHYDAHAKAWIDIASGWSNTNQCGDSYHGLNIAFQPAYTWARLESDPVRKVRVQTEVLRDAMWSEVWDHKNVFFG